MSRVKYNPLPVLLMLLIFIGQSLAPAVMACQMDNHSAPMKMDMSAGNHQNMMHTNHDMSGMKMSHGSSSAMDDCCVDECTCPMGSCTQAALIDELSVNFPFLTQQISLTVTSTVIDAPSSLYRPPIQA